MANKISASENRRRVKESMEKTGTERINLYLPKGTRDRIKSFGYKQSDFVKSLVLSELDRLEKLSTKK